MNRVLTVLPLLAALATPLPRAPVVPGTDASFAIRDVRVFDGERVTAGATVIVRGDRIVEVSPKARIPEGAAVIHGRGKTLLPGFVDAHTHTWDRKLLRQALVFGVTTQLDMFTSVGFSQEMRREEQAGGAADRADLFAAGIAVTAPGGHGTQYGVPIPTLDSPEEADAFVEARLKEGSDYIKLILEGGRGKRRMPTLSRETYEAVVRAAHRRGKMAVTHVTSQEHARQAIVAGSDGLVHIYDEGRPDADLARLAKHRGIFVVPTLTVMRSLAGLAGGEKVATDSPLEPYLPESAVINLRMTFPVAPAPDRYSVAREMVKLLNREDVPILAGSDAPNPGTTHGASLHRELELLVGAGLTPIEALRAATSAPAKAFALGDRGRIRPGLRADLLLVRGDPTRHIQSTRNIDTIWKAGIQVDRAAVLAEVQQERELAQRERQAPPPPGAETGRVSDFEDGTQSARFGAGWSVTTDAKLGGRSRAAIEVVAGGADGSNYALSVTGEIVAGTPNPWAGAMFSPGPEPMVAANLSSKKAIAFWAKGDGRRHLILIFSRHRGAQPLVSAFLAELEWKRHVIPLAEFEGIDGRDIQGIAFVGNAASPGPFSFLVDDVRFE